MNVGEWILKRSEIHPDRLFVKHGERRLDNREFNRLVNRAAHLLQSQGVGKGDRVAVILDNRIEFLLFVFACAKTGAIVVPLHHQTIASDLVFFLDDCRPKVVVHGPETEKELTAVQAEYLEPCSFIGLKGIESATGSPWDLLTSKEENEPTASDPVELEDPFLIMYIPSAAGTPRGAVLSHGNILFGAIHALISYGIDKSYRSLVLAPMCQIGALTASVLSIVYGGGGLILDNFFNPSHALSLITKEKVNYLFAVPVMFHMMTKAPEWPSADFSHVHYFISGGAPLPLEVIEKYQQEKGILFPQGYGMTETGRLTSLDLEDTGRKAGSVGKEVFHMFLRIVDDSGRDVPQGEVGEIIVRGPNVFSGYWNRPRDTAEAIKEGWFYTADLGRRDEEGFLYLVGRKMETIISAGRNIYPAEIEQAITGLDGVKETAVVGLPDPAKGQVIGALVVLEQGINMTAGELSAALAGKTAPYKYPKVIRFVDGLPRNTVGRVDREQVRSRLAARRQEPDE